MEGNRTTWRSSRRSSGRLGGGRAAVVLHLKAQLHTQTLLSHVLLGLTCLPHIMTLGLTVLLGACWVLYSGFGSLKLGTSE